MVKIDNLTFGYSKNKNLFDQMNMQLEAGHIYGLFGENGAGKSTLLKNMVGLVYAQQGSIEVMGFNPRKRNPKMLQNICFIPEEFDLPGIGIEAYVKSIAGFYPKFDRAELQQLLNEFDVPKDQKLSEMSYGQKKKFIIAFGLATNAKLIVMDEPTNGLDIPSKTQFRKIMSSVLTDERCIVISTHQVRDLDNLIDTVIVLNENKVALNASVDEITKKLLFKKVRELDETAIYGEPSLMGYQAIFKNTDQQESKLDIELLFNAMLNSKEQLYTIFNQAS
ncbi:ABC-2 type transport system ATP-binding protein [Pedobacter sp. UYP30]|uniref:ABC transporter ATP-binding protein n=1 Tax=Pedobacter sp. UYP30 TaxID=1756400 RepID=UPI003396F115